MAEYQKVCEWCGAGFVAGRSDKRFCSRKCRNAALRAATPEKAREAKRAWCAANPEKVRGWHRAYRAANLEKVRANDRARHAANPEKKRADSRARYAANPEKMLERANAYYAENTEKVLEMARMRRRSTAPIELALHMQNVMMQLKTEGDT
jgi:hypothetical protein